MATQTAPGPLGHHDQHHRNRRSKHVHHKASVRSSHASTPAPLGKTIAASWITVAEGAQWMLLPVPSATIIASNLIKLAVSMTRKIAFGKKVSLQFKARVIEIATNIQTDPNYLMAAMAFESQETFKPDIPNAKGSGAVGLIQFMPDTAKALGTTSADLKKMTAVKQLDYVEKYFLPYKGRLSTLSDVYMVILWPAAVGKPNNYVLFKKDDKKHPKFYEQNAGLDLNKDGKVTKSEAASSVQKKLEKGLKPENLG